MTAEDKKYAFTQLSGVFVGITSVLILLFIIKKLFPSFLCQNNYLSVAILGALLFIGLIGSILLWGKFLVLIGLLSKKEAKGYPFTKSWGKNSHYE